MLSAAEISREIAVGARTAVSVVEEVLRRIEAGDGAVRAIAELRAEVALREAAEVDRGERTGSLAGVPITIKEAIHVGGMRSTWGLTEAREHRAEHDAEVVARLRAAGAVVVATTTAHAMLADFTRTESPLYGRTDNPSAPGHRPGGSSGGSAAAIAAGFSCLDVGSDLVGSVRIPAAFCGVHGLRPTAGSVPLGGFAPPGAPAAPPETTYLSTLGPLGATADDLRLALEVMTDAPLAPVRTPDPTARWVLDDPELPTDPEVRAVLKQAVERLSGTAATGWPSWADPAADRAAFAAHLDAFFVAMSGGQPSVSADDPARRAAIGRWERTFAEVDVVLCPVFPSGAPEHDTSDPDDYGAQAGWITYASLCGLPAASIPVGATTAGLPVGLQVIGPPGGDLTVLAAARQLQA